MGRSRLRTLLVTSVVIMLCAAMIVGGTYALFSDSVEVTNHLVAGTLKVKLERIDLEQWRLDEDGNREKDGTERNRKNGRFYARHNGKRFRHERNGSDRAFV